MNLAHFKAIQSGNCPFATVAEAGKYLDSKPNMKAFFREQMDTLRLDRRLGWTLRRFDAAVELARAA
jgi:hypothetical protein